jgi:hypothetical protein
VCAFPHLFTWQCGVCAHCGAYAIRTLGYMLRVFFDARLPCPTANPTADPTANHQLALNLMRRTNCRPVRTSRMHIRVALRPLRHTLPTQYLM